MLLSLVVASFLLVADRPKVEASPWAPQHPKQIVGTSRPIASRDGRLELVWRRNDDEGVHEIWLQPAKDHTRARRIYALERNASVLWSPNGKMVAITDACGSDTARVGVLAVFVEREPLELTTVARDVERFFVDDKGDAIFDHSYARAIRWSRDSTMLQIHLRAHNPIHEQAQRLFEKRITVKTLFSPVPGETTRSKPPCG